jgi:capsular polysaccharide transport system ATP-binding protein
MVILDGVHKVYRARNLHKRILEAVDLKIERGDALAVLGANGAGKSTLLRLICGLEHPSAGRVLRRDMSISWPIGFSSCFQSSLTGADNARFIARIYRRDPDDLLDFVEAFAELGAYLRQPVRSYSSGMAARLAFGISLAIEFDCYLVDEVTAAGDARFRQRCHEALQQRRESGALVMVSHDMEALRAYCTRGAVLAGGRLTVFEDLEQAIAFHHAAQLRAA